MECLTCKSLSGEKRISPGPFIYESKFWIVEHAYPTKLKGWLVIVLKRHCKALHELNKEEFIELGEITYKVVKALHEVLGTEKEYSVCFAEKEYFNHIHFHMALCSPEEMPRTFSKISPGYQPCRLYMIPRSKDLPGELKGTNIFSMLKIDEEHAVPKNEVIEICMKLKMFFSKTFGSAS